MIIRKEVWRIEGREKGRSPGELKLRGPFWPNGDAQDKDGYQYEYDYENRITKIMKSGPSTVAEFAYDALGMRIEKKDSITSANTRRYYYNANWQTLSEYDTNDVHKKSYVYGNYIDEVLMMPSSASFLNRYYLHDHLYSPVALTDYNGVTIERYEYDAYGNCQIMDAYYNPRSSSSYGNPYYFTGREMDSFDGGNLKIQYNRNRYYDYYTGRFTGQDPMGYMDGLNLYQYADSCPVSQVDPMGLWGISLKSFCLAAADAYIGQHRGSAYYRIFGLDSVDGKVMSSLMWLEASDYLPLPPGTPSTIHALFDAETRKLYVNVPIGPKTIFHEGIHVYLFRRNIYQGAHERRWNEGVATAAEQMMWPLEYLNEIEQLLKLPSPDRKGLKVAWVSAWGLASSSILGYPGTYYDARGRDIDFEVDFTDVSHVRSTLGFRLRCNDIADTYNRILWWKGWGCIRFSCYTGPSDGTPRQCGTIYVKTPVPSEFIGTEFRDDLPRVFPVEGLRQ